MRRFFTRLTLFVMLQGTIASIIFPGALAQRRPGYLAALDDKLALLRTVESPRVVFVGGSSVAFGIESQVFEQGLGRPAINLGLHGALGLDFYLRIVEQHSRPGDLIVLLPEYAMLSARHKMTTDNMRRLLRNCPSAYRYLAGNASSGKQFLDTMALSELAYWTQRGIELQRKKWRRSTTSKPAIATFLPNRASSHPPDDSRDNPTIYRRRSFNRNGDMVAHHRCESPPLREIADGFPWDEEVLTQSVQRLNRCAEICRRHGAEVVFSYAPIVDQQWYRHRDCIARLHRILDQSLRMPIVNRPQDSAFPISEFFDSENHLVEAAQHARSQILLRGLSIEIASRPELSGRQWR